MSELSPLTGVRTPCLDGHMTTTQSFSTNVYGGEFSSTTRGIARHSGVYTAITQAHSREFKTLAGAVAFMARYGYDAHGRRL